MVFSSVMKIHNKIAALIIFNLIGCVVILGASYLLASYGLVGIGWGLFIGQIIISLAFSIYYAVVLKPKFLFLKD